MIELPAYFEVIPLIHSHVGPVLFAGDFNTKNEERVNVLGEMLLAEGLVCVTWDNPLPGKQLDQAYVRGLKVRMNGRLLRLRLG